MALTEAEELELLELEEAEAVGAEKPRTAVDVAMKSVTTHDVPAAPVDESVRDTLTRLLKDAYSPEGFKMEDQLSLSAGKAGPGRFLESEGKRVGSAVRAAGKNLADKFVELPGVNKFPKAAAGTAAAGSAVVDLLSDSLTPSSQQIALGTEPIVAGARAVEMGITSRLAQKLSGLSKWLADVIMDRPQVMKAGGTPESADAALEGLRDVIGKADAAHRGTLTAARDAARPGELAEVEKSVGGIQDVIKNARKEAGSRLEGEQKALGIHETLEEKAAKIASGEAGRELSAPEVVRQTLGALDPAAPKGRESIANLVNLRREIDKLVDFSNKGIKPVSSETEAVLTQLRGRINDRIGGVQETPFLKSVMGVESAQRGATENIGAPLRAAERNFADVARITEGLTPKFETVPKGVSTIRTQAKGGLRSIDPDVAALEDLAGGREALARAESAVSKFDAGEEAFNEGLKKFDPVTGKFSDTPTAINTIRDQFKKGLGDVDPTVQQIEGISGGKEALGKAQDEVARYLMETADVGQPGNTATLIAQSLGFTPNRAAKFLSIVGRGSDAEMMARYPKLYKAAVTLHQAAARGVQAVSSTDYILQQQDPEYRLMMNTLKDAKE